MTTTHNPQSARPGPQLLDPEQYRPLFPITEHYTYLNHASCAAICVPAIEAVQQYLAAQSRQGVYSEAEWWPHVETARAKLARLIGADESEIAWVPNDSTALNMVAHGLPWAPGDNVVTTAEQFPANVYPWLHLRADGVEVRFVARRDGRVLLDDIAAALDARTRLVAVSWVEFNSGFRQDLAALAALVHARDALLCVDAMQGLGALTLDVHAAGVDFLGTGVHKWLLGPLGVGILYVRADRLEGLRPRLANWRSVPAHMDFTNLTQPWLPTARRFEGGTPSLMEIIAFEAVLDLFHRAGPAAIAAQVRALTDRLIDQLDAHGYAVYSSRVPAERSGIVCFSPRGDEPADSVVARLEAAHIGAAARMGVVRISPHFYNTFAEIDRLFAPGLLE